MRESASRVAQQQLRVRLEVLRRPRVPLHSEHVTVVRVVYELSVGRSVERAVWAGREVAREDPAGVHVRTYTENHIWLKKTPKQV